MKGMVFDIKRFSIHDGPGIRTTVFLKGCPLHCIWCHNPESQKYQQEILFDSDKCIACGWCLENCSQHAHAILKGKHIFKREKCISCGKCTEKCYAGALELIGKEMTISEVLAKVIEDKILYDNSSGGMTISGGEPMSQPDFTAALLSEAKKYGLHTCLDTCGFANWKQYEKVLDNTDLFLFDLKDTNPKRHQKNTGVALKPILENLNRLNDAGKKIYLRCPIIPGLNDQDEHIKKIAETVIFLDNLLEIKLLAYHPLGSSKLEFTGRENKLKINKFTNMEQLEKFRTKLEKITKNKVTI